MVLSVLISSLVMPTIIAPVSVNWTQIGSKDRNEGGRKNDWRDVEFAYYGFTSDVENIGLKLYCYGNVGSEWPKSGGRYKWFIATENPNDMSLSGGNIIGANYLIYVEYSEIYDNPVMFLVIDSNFDGSFNDETPAQVLSDFFDIDGTQISMFIPLEMLGNPSTFAVTWATDQQDPNLNAAPNNDRVDGKVGVAGIIEVPRATQIVVNTLVVDTPPDSEWKYTISGPEGFSQTFTSLAQGSIPTWTSDDDLTPGLYYISLTSKFGYYSTIDLQGDSDGGSIIGDFEVTVDLDEDEVISLSFKNTFLPAFTISLENAPPVDLDYNIPPLTPTLVQSAWSTDINGDGSIDVVLGKPMAVLLNFSGYEGSSVSASVTFEGVTYTGSSDDLTSNPIITIYPIIPNAAGDKLLTGTFSVNDGSAQSLPDIDVTVKQTTGPSIAYSHLYKLDRKGNYVYGNVELNDYQNTVDTCTYLLETTYPVSSLLTDESYVGVEGADKGNKRDPFKGLLADALAVAQDAQLRMGGTAIGIGLGPIASDTDYFDYHGFGGAVISVS